MCGRLWCVGPGPEDRAECLLRWLMAGELGDSTLLIGSSHEPCKALSWVVIVAATAPRATVPVEDRLATLGRPTCPWPGLLRSS